MGPVFRPGPSFEESPMGVHYLKKKSKIRRSCQMASARMKTRQTGANSSTAAAAGRLVNTADKK